MSAKGKIPKTHCPNCNSFLGEIVTGTPFCNKCKCHHIMKDAVVVKTVLRDFYNGTDLKDVV